jgi:hypothetical protein
LYPETTRNSYFELWKLKLPAWNRNSVSPVGTVAPFLYWELNPKFARPLSNGIAGYDPGSTFSQPPPVMKPAFGS